PPRPPGRRPARRRRLDVQLAGLVTGGRAGVARRRHRGRAPAPARQRPLLTGPARGHLRCARGGAPVSDRPSPGPARPESRNPVAADQALGGRVPRLSATDSATALLENGVSASFSRLWPLGSGSSVTVANRPSTATPTTRALVLLRPITGSSAVSA